MATFEEFLTSEEFPLSHPRAPGLKRAFNAGAASRDAEVAELKSMLLSRQQQCERMVDDIEKLSDDVDDLRSKIEAARAWIEKWRVYTPNPLSMISETRHQCADQLEAALGKH